MIIQNKKCDGPVDLVFRGKVTPNFRTTPEGILEQASIFPDGTTKWFAVEILNEDK